MSALERGDLLPRMATAPPGARSRSLCETLEEAEAPVVNTLIDGQPSVVWREALGSNVVDVDDNRYIDLTAGFGAAGVGHRHPRVVDALRRQSGLLLHGLGDVHPHPTRIELAARLRAIAPMADAQVYFAASGADAVEVALKTAVLATGRTGVVAFEPSYHGLTLGALSVSSRPAFREPFQSLLRPEVHRLPFGCSASKLDELLEEHADIGAVIFEPIAGREGVIVPPEGWARHLGECCQQRGVLLIADEVFTGFGRTGPMFATEEEGTEVDMVCCGKALGGGLPIGVVLGRRAVFRSWNLGGEALHTCTFLANPLSCSAALAVLDIFENEGLVQRVRDLGQVVGARLRPWRDIPEVVDVRGRGLLWGVELSSRTAAAAIAKDALREGVLILPTGKEGTVLEICPPLTISEAQIEAALDILEPLISASRYEK